MKVRAFYLLSRNIHANLRMVDGEEVISRSGPAEPKTVKKMNFFLKFAELQLLMLQHNAGLTASHPYASGPINWPFLLNGISFWTENDSRQQIYLAGNPVGWWICVMALSVFVGITGADLMARRRNVKPIPEGEILHRMFYPNLSNTNVIRNSESAPKLNGIFCFCLGIPLLPILPYEPSAVCPSLPPSAPCLSTCCGISSQLRTH